VCLIPFLIHLGGYVEIAASMCYSVNSTVTEPKISKLELILAVGLQYVENVLWLYISMNDALLYNTVKRL
jgi:hypothetical protein